MFLTMENRARRVVVTGLGVVSPVGNDVETTWRNLVDGVSGIGPITQFDASDLDTRFGGELKDFDPRQYMDRKEVRRHDRFVHMAVAAADQAMQDAGIEPENEDPTRAAIVIGSGIGGFQTVFKQYDIMRERGVKRVSPFFLPAMIIDTAGAYLAIRYGFKGPSFGVVSACATGTNAIGEAFRMLKNGLADVALAGGSEASMIRLAFAGFNVMRAMSTRNDEPEKASRPFDATRDGFVLGEGAAVLVLETLEHALARGARIYAEVVGYGTNVDGYHLAQPAENGEGIQRAMKEALAEADLAPHEVDYINAHGTSTPLNDVNETRAIKAVFGEAAYDLAVNSTKSMTGHLMGAAGALEALVTVKTIETGIIHPTINYEYPDPECDLDYVPNVARKADVRVGMSNSMGLGGHNASIIFRRFENGSK
nr:beta-ketoacyl-ACP synthase II [Ardenticatena sp.]